MNDETTSQVFRESSYGHHVPTKCVEPTKYVHDVNSKYRTTYPLCIYFDENERKCTLNGCIRNIP